MSQTSQLKCLTIQCNVTDIVLYFLLENKTKHNVTECIRHKQMVRSRIKIKWRFVKNLINHKQFVVRRKATTEMILSKYSYTWINRFRFIFPLYELFVPERSPTIRQISSSHRMFVAQGLVWYRNHLKAQKIIQARYLVIHRQTCSASALFSSAKIKGPSSHKHRLLIYWNMVNMFIFQFE